MTDVKFSDFANADNASYPKPVGLQGGANVQIPANALARAIQDAIATAVNFPFAGNVTAANLSGTNSGDQIAATVPYSNAASGLASTNVQDAIDELAAASGGGGSTHANVSSSATLSHTINRYTAGSVAGTTPASPADFDELEVSIEDASYTGCTLVANTGQTVNGASSLSFNILPCVMRFRYNLAATNWFPLYYRIGTL